MWWTHARWPTRCLLAGLLLGSAGPALPGCSDATGANAGNCELIFNLGTTDPDPDTRLQIVNDLAGGLEATVGHENFTSSSAEMAPGECVAWGVFADVFELRLQQCLQEIPVQRSARARSARRSSAT